MSALSRFPSARQAILPSLVGNFLPQMRTEFMSVMQLDSVSSSRACPSQRTQSKLLAQQPVLFQV